MPEGSTWRRPWLLAAGAVLLLRPSALHAYLLDVAEDELDAGEEQHGRRALERVQQHSEPQPPMPMRTLPARGVHAAAGEGLAPLMEEAAEKSREMLAQMSQDKTFASQLEYGLSSLHASRYPFVCPLVAYAQQLRDWWAMKRRVAEMGVPQHATSHLEVGSESVASELQRSGTEESEGAHASVGEPASPQDELSPQTIAQNFAQHAQEQAAEEQFAAGDAPAPPTIAHAQASQEQHRQVLQQQAQQEQQPALPSQQQPRQHQRSVVPQVRQAHNLHGARRKPSPAQVAAEEEVFRSETRSWFLYFLVSMGIWFFLLLLCGSDNTVLVETDDADDAISTMRGRPCWDMCLAVAVVLLSLFMFWMTTVSIGLANEHTRLAPETIRIKGDTTVITTRMLIDNPGPRAFLAGTGVTASVFAAVLAIAAWRKYSEVAISTGLLCQYAVRGGSFSLAVALLLVFGGLFLLGQVGLETLGTYMALVGFGEEYAKVVAVTLGTLLMVSAARDDKRDCGSMLCNRTLVEDPKGLMLAGMAAGFGFMTVENGLYVMAAATMPPTKEVTYQRTAMGEVSKGTVLEEDELVNVSIVYITIMTILVRVLLNIHPWLCGICAGRVARVAFPEKRPTACLDVCEMNYAILPSSVVHACYDFFVTVLGAPVGLVCPVVFWWGSRRYFADLWEEFCQSKQQQTWSTQPGSAEAFPPVAKKFGVTESRPPLADAPVLPEAPVPSSRASSATEFCPCGVQ
eukprot:TRINITY_DN30917_c0_g1_i1.p1 TRINITY_DN30917_c0_g1~~TRINITY_DN30917_c0_g1_i1.p1  ORF type:complete len:765 (-),score=191.22 TRINITY_DN30917_c0_g1_i1:112-2337(-)